MTKKKRVFEELELEIESIGFEGVAIARKDGVVHFVKNAVPGDTVRVNIKKKKKSYVETFFLELLNPSPLRETPRCEHFGICGGCTWQNLQYPEQIKWKRQHVIDAFERLGKIPYGEMYETLGSPEIFHYRNKMDFSFASSRWLTDEEVANNDEIKNKTFALGLHVPGRFDKVVDVNACHIQPAIGNKLLTRIREKALEYGVTPFDARNFVGFLRSLIIRSTIAYNQNMVILITKGNTETDEEIKFINWFENDFKNEFPEFDNIILALNSTRSPVAIDSMKQIKGNGFIKENILGVDYQISPFSFFQTNATQLNQFIGKIIDFADLQSNEIIWDLYCGTGSITLPASKKCKKIYGVELVESSIIDAKINANLNNIINAEFFCADLHNADTPELLNSLENPNCIIIDPPRAGVHKNLLEHIKSINPSRLVYVSCNPATQARDCAELASHYRVVKVQPVDMFPHTYHVESIALLERV